jgi:hypothetical protein
MVEPQIVVLVVAGSSPVGHPAFRDPEPKFEARRRSSRYAPKRLDRFLRTEVLNPYKTVIFFLR